MKTPKPISELDVANKIALLGYSSYTALISNHLWVITNGNLIIGKEYFINEVFEGDSFINVGAITNTPQEKFIATGTTPSNWNNGSTLFYDYTPIDIVLNNTIGNYHWELYDNGIIVIIFDNVIDIDKCFIYLNTLPDADPLCYTDQMAGIEIGPYPNSFRINAKINLLSKASMEIRVYP